MRYDSFICFGLFSSVRANVAAKGVYCTAEPAVVCPHLAACSSGNVATAAASSSVKSKRNRNSLDIGYEKKSLHQVSFFPAHQDAFKPLLFGSALTDRLS